MYLSELDLQYLINNARAVCTKPVFIIHLNWKILSCTHPDLTSYAEEILTRCAADNDFRATANDYGILMEPCLWEDTLICYFMILDRKSTYMLPYLNILTQLLIAPQVSELQGQSANSRSMLVNQLANSGQKSSEINVFMKELGYSYDCPRCALLFEVNRQSSDGADYKFDSSDNYLERLVLESGSYSREDIYGFLSTERYLVFKDISGWSEEEGSRKLADYAEKLAADFRKSRGIPLFCALGSSYSSLYQLRQSYLEALFLITNYDYLNSDERLALRIQDYIFEYAVSRIPRDYWDNRFRGLSMRLRETPALLETAIELSKVNLNLTRASETLGLHRNTLLQRFSKIKNVTGLAPLQSDHDRMVLRAFALHQNQKITLQAGIVIQPNSVLHQGMQKMAELVYKHSGGTININIHTLSTSGNNAHLFEILRSGSIDFVVAATGVMNKFTGNRSKVLEFPFLFQSSEEANHILNTTIIEDLESALNSIGVKCLSIWTMGWRYLSSKEPVRVPQDLVGKKVRVMFTESLDSYYLSMGAIPIKMNYGDVMDALRSGIIDCQENPYSNTLGMRFYEEQKYITRLKYYLSTEALYISSSAWNKLTPVQMELITSAAKETTDWIFREQQTVINQQCKNILVQEKGVEIIEVSQEEAGQWRTYAQSLYTSFPHQDLLKKIEKSGKEYYAKHRTE